MSRKRAHKGDSDEESEGEFELVAKLQCPECAIRPAAVSASWRLHKTYTAQSIVGHFRSKHPDQPSDHTIAELAAKGIVVQWCHNCNRIHRGSRCRSCCSRPKKRRRMAGSGEMSPLHSSLSSSSLASASPSCASAPAVLSASPSSTPPPSAPVPLDLFCEAVSRAAEQGLDERSADWLRSLESRVGNSAVAAELACRSDTAAVRAVLFAIAAVKGRTFRAMPSALWHEWRIACRPHLTKFTVAASGDDKPGMINAYVGLVCTALECLRWNGSWAFGKVDAARRALQAHFRRPSSGQAGGKPSASVSVAAAAVEEVCDWFGRSVAALISGRCTH